MTVAGNGTVLARSHPKSAAVHRNTRGYKMLRKEKANPGGVGLWELVEMAM